jgi:hypothetical protein
MFGILKFYTHWPFVKFCRTSNKTKMEKLNEQLSLMEQRVHRATVDGEDGWFLQLEHHSIRSNC